MTDPLLGSQNLAAKKAEAARPFHGKTILENRELAVMFRDRATVTLRDLALLKDQGVHFSPFLEIGAGSGQRSAALTHAYRAEGVATDISQDSLRDVPFVLSLLGYEQSPLLISCDGLRLPFMEDTFQFVFLYQTLHHFEDPAPLVKECYRVLGRGGHLFLNEEPMDSPLKRMLRGRRHLSHPLTKVQKAARRLQLDRIFWDDSALELSLGMVEARFDIGVWREALAPFEQVSVEISRRFKLRSDLYQPFVPALLSALWGGNVWCLCRKTGGSPVEQSILERLICVDCGADRILRSRENGLNCLQCGRVYLSRDGVVRMLQKELEAALDRQL